LRTVKSLQGTVPGQPLIKIEIIDFTQIPKRLLNLLTNPETGPDSAFF